MFESSIYIDRRDRLVKALGNDGLVIIFGNEESLMNYMDNT